VIAISATQGPQFTQTSPGIRQLNLHLAAEPIIPRPPAKSVTRDSRAKSEEMMTRIPLSLPVADLSAFARALHRELPAVPGHLSLMNMLARAAGFRNLQHLRASAKAGATLAAHAAPAADLTRVQAALRFFDKQGRMSSWPSRTNIQHLCLWVLWSRLPRGESLTERQISARLTEWHLFGDPAILRRTLVELGLVSRAEGASAYLRIERQPTPEATALIRQLHRLTASSTA
jgi:hypothetical protein